MTAGQRIEKLVRWTGLSVHAFAIGIGLKRSENIYQIKKGNNGISRNLAEMIIAKYPTISKGWLLSGEGEMITTLKPKSKKAALPFFNQDVEWLIKNQFTSQPSSTISIELYNDADFAAPYMSDAMCPEIPMGAIIICKKTDRENIISGASYLVATDNLIGVRNIRIAENQTLRLEAANSLKYDTITISRAQIKELYIVKGFIVNKSL